MKRELSYHRPLMSERVRKADDAVMAQVLCRFEGVGFDAVIELRTAKSARRRAARCAGDGAG